MFDHLPIFTLKFYRKLSFSRYHEISGPILVTECMATYNDGSIPCRYQSRYVFYYDRLTENSTVKNIADGAVGTLPHLLQVKFAHPCLIWCNGGTLYSNT